MGPSPALPVTPPADLQSEIERANALGGQFVLLGRPGEGFEVYRRLYERMLAYEAEHPGERLHKGLPLHNMGWARLAGGDVEGGVTYTLLAFIEDSISRAAESPNLVDELSRPSAATLRSLGVPDAELLSIAEAIRRAVGRRPVESDSHRLSARLNLRDRLSQWIVPTDRAPHPIRVFVSSPRELRSARRLVAETCRQLTLVLGVQVQALLWEGAGPMNPESPPFPAEIRHGAQGVIDDHVWGRLGGYDVYVGMLWRRMGTPTGAWRSGTEAEFRLALEHRAASGRPAHILFYRRIPTGRDKVDPAVIDFVGELRGLGLAQPFRSLEEFRRMIFDHLHSLVRERLGET